MTEDVTHSLLISFPDQSESFVLGFEAGKIWAQMESGTVAEIETLIHYSNQEVIRRQALALGWSYCFTATTVEGWIHAVLTKTAKAPERPNPHGLSLVKG